jgi:uncharacterized membrane protein (UPF0127 family)
MIRAMNRAAFFGLFLMVGQLLGQQSAQVPLPAIMLSVGGKAVFAEVADDPQERETGLMFRKSLAPDSGMLFVMPEPEHAAFWMKNTTLPLSVAYINQSGMILEIHDLRPLDERPVPSAFSNIAYALEMEQGWFARNRVLAGDRIKGLPALTGR